MQFEGIRIKSSHIVAVAKAPKMQDQPGTGIALKVN